MNMKAADMMDIQKFMDAITSAARDTRKQYHLTLGGLISALDAAPPTAKVVFDDGCGVGEEDSYRGYYSDLALTTGPIQNAAALAKRMKAAAGSTYEGYKGGDFTMGLDTPLWRASYGNCGPAIISAHMDGKQLILVVKDVDPCRHPRTRKADGG